MKKKNLICLCLSLVLLFSCWVVPVSAETEPSDNGGTTGTFVPTMPPLPGQEVSGEELRGDASVNNGSHSINAQVPVADLMDYLPDCKAALLYELDTETMLYGYNIDQKLYPASLTKVMTCLVALEMCEDLSEVITVPEAIIAEVDPSGSGIDLVAGEEVTMMDLLYGLMVESANDAASVIADHLCGSEEAFVRKMNQRAAQLGCEQTNFVNVHGLHNEEHYTTARDIARIMLACLENETFEELYSTSSYKMAATNKSEARQMYTTNYLISEAILQAYYDTRVIGGKTGSTTPAGRCLVTVSEDNGMRFLCVILGAQIQYGDDGWTVLNYGSFEQTQALLDFGFDHFMPTQVLSPNQMLGQFDVTNGSADVQGVVRGTVDTVLPADSQLSSVRYEYTLDRDTLTAPVEAGQPIGIVRVWYQTKCLAQQELYAGTSVAKDIATTVEGGSVDPAAPVKPAGNFWHIVLTAILILLALIAGMLMVGYIRGAMLRARRARCRKNRRRSR